MFDRAADRCRLFCRWCAQDIEANYFWESLGFVPLAFRSGSAKKSRMHIFWQRRILAGDANTPYWFPSQTTSGSIREDRLVLPISPGTHWSDAKPIVLPALSAVEGPASGMGGSPMVLKQNERHGRAARASKKLPAIKPSAIMSGGLRFAAPKEAAIGPNPKPKREPKQKVKNDPRLVAAARELRDRWLARVNANPSVLLASAKYDVSKALAAPRGAVVTTIPALPEPVAA